MVRLVTAADDGVLVGHSALICDRDRKWSRAVRQQLGDAGIRVVLTPVRAPNANAYAERFVRSIKEKCLDRMIPVGEGHFRRAVAEFVTHYHPPIMSASPSAMDELASDHHSSRCSSDTDQYC
jgi:hypothetical protein